MKRTYEVLQQTATTLFRSMTVAGVSRRRFRKNIDPFLHGTVAPGFQKVREEFKRNFTGRNEWGAACSACFCGEKVVDLWGGFRDMRIRAPWQDTTLVNFLSASGGLAALAAAIAVSRGWLEPDAPVARYWPGFGQNGREGITVRRLLAHQAGLPVLSRAIDVRRMPAREVLASILCRQEPLWRPGTYHGCHAATLGLYLDALISRADPAHRGLDRFFQDEIARPLGMEWFFALPGTVAADRVARTMQYGPIGLVFRMPWSTARGFLNPFSLGFRARHALRNFDPNDRAGWSIVHPSCSGIGQVRAVARAYGACAAGGRELGLDKKTLKELCRPAVDPRAGPRDLVLRADRWYSMGFHKPGPDLRFGSSRRAFGAFDPGGSCGFADPDRKLGFAYATTRPGYHPDCDPRATALMDAVYSCLRKA